MLPGASPFLELPWLSNAVFSSFRQFSVSGIPCSFLLQIGMRLSPLFDITSTTSRFCAQRPFSLFEHPLPFPLAPLQLCYEMAFPFLDRFMGGDFCLSVNRSTFRRFPRRKTRSLSGSGGLFLTLVLRPSYTSPVPSQRTPMRDRVVQRFKTFLLSEPPKEGVGTCCCRFFPLPRPSLGKHFLVVESAPPLRATLQWSLLEGLSRPGHRYLGPLCLLAIPYHDLDKWTVSLFLNGLQ